MNTELKPHPCAEFIKAWADGHTIQIAGQNGEWFDLDDAPAWNLKPSMYRIKPRMERTVYGYRRYIGRNVFSEVTVGLCLELIPPRDIEQRDTFIAWIDTEWQYHEIEITN